MRRQLARALVHLALGINWVARKALALAERLAPSDPAPGPAPLTPEAYSAASQAVRAQALLDPARKAQRGASA